MRYSRLWPCTAVALTLLFFSASGVSGASGASGTSGTGTRHYRLQPVWTIADSGAEPFVFGIIEDVLIGRDNRVFVLDSQVNNIKVFSATGRFLGTIGEEGEGPGQIRSVGSLGWMPDGALGVGSKMLARIYKFDVASGYPHDDFLGAGQSNPLAFFGQFCSHRDWPDHSFAAVVREMGQGKWNVRSYLGVFQDFGRFAEEPATRVLHEVGLTEGADAEEEEYYWLWRPWTIDALGRLVMAPYWSEYKLRYFDHEGRQLLEATLPFEQRAREQDEKSRFLNLMWGGISPASFGVDLVYSDVEAVVREIYPRPNGELWVRTNRSGWHVPDDVFMELDIISPEGESAGKAILHGADDASLDRVYFGQNGRIVVVKNGEGHVRTARGTIPADDDYELVLQGYDLVQEGNP